MRELLCGSRRFGEVRRGIPRISRTMLSARLRELLDTGVIERQDGAGGPEYRLTRAGEELAAVVRELGTWGQRWLPRELHAGQLDVDPLLRDIHRRVRRDALPDKPIVLRIELADVRGPAGRRYPAPAQRGLPVHRQPRLPGGALSACGSPHPDRLVAGRPHARASTRGGPGSRGPPRLGPRVSDLVRALHVRGRRSGFPRAYRSSHTLGSSPPGYARVANKTGNFADVIHDAGIVPWPGVTLVIAVLTQGVRPAWQAMDAIAEVAAILVEVCAGSR